MDQALIQVGLPVKCDWADCGTTGFVKAGSDHGGWHRHTLKRWYCPKHAKKAAEQYKAFQDKYATPEPEVSTEEELYKLLD
ncbi:MAG: hypothetical protein V4440_04440 [Pseudomonadota bacterium]